MDTDALSTTEQVTIEFEQALLGSLIIDRSKMPDVGLVGLKCSHFLRPVHAAIYRTLIEVDRASGPATLFDPLLINEQLSITKREFDGSAEYLMRLVEIVPTSRNANEYALRVMDYWHRRNTHRALTQATNAVLAPEADIHMVTSALFEEIGRNGNSRHSIFRDEVHTVIEWTERPKNDDWVLNGLIRKGELAFLYGAPKSGKTFVALDLLISLAAGESWCGDRYSVNESRFVLLAIGEGFNGLTDRLNAALQARDLTPNHLGNLFRIVPAVPQLFDSASPLGANNFIAAIKSNGAILPDLVVIDTYARAIVGGEENSNRDAGIILASLQRIQTEIGCAVLVIHHANKSMGEMRGASAVLGGADLILKCKKDGRSRMLEVEFAKDIPETKPVTFSLVPSPTGSVYVSWGGESSSSSRNLDDRILAFLNGETEAFTAREIAEATDNLPNLVTRCLWKLKRCNEVDWELRNPAKAKSPANPMIWRGLRLTTFEAEEES